MPRLVLSFTLFMIFFSTYAQPGERCLYGGVMYKRSGLGFALQNKVDISEKWGKQYDIELTYQLDDKDVQRRNTNSLYIIELLT